MSLHLRIVGRFLARRCRWVVGCLMLVLAAAGSDVASAAAPPAAAFTFGYDDMGQLVQVSDPGGYTARYVMDPVGNLTSITRQTSATVTVAQLAPQAGSVGSTVRIFGSGFSATASQDTVKFNGTTATVSSALPGQLVVTVPSGATSGTVSVTAPAGSASSASAFSVSSAHSPTITSVSTALAMPGTALSVTGTNFDGAVATNDNLAVNRTRALVSASTSATLTSSVPAGAGSGAVKIATKDGQVAGPDLFIPPPGYTVGGVAQTGRLTLGTSKAVSIGAANGIAMFVFDGKTNERIALDLSNQTFGGIFKLYDPYNNLVASSGSGNYFIDTRLPSQGTYTAVVDPGGSTGTANITVSDIGSDVQATTTPSAAGGQTTMAIAVPGQNGTITFTGTAGQRISVDVKNNTFSGSNVPYCKLNLGISSPDGSQLTGPNCVTGAYTPFLDTIVLPQTGTYTIAIDPQGDAVGSASVIAYQVPTDFSAQLTPTSSGASTTMTTSTPGQNGTITFTGTPGSQITLNMTTDTYHSDNVTCHLTVGLFNPDGSALLAPGCVTGVYSPNLGPVTLGQSGTYTVKLDPQDDATGSVTVTAYLVPADFTAQVTPTAQGAAVTMSTSTPGSNGKITFAGSPGQRISIVVTNNSYNGQNTPYCKLAVGLNNPDATALVPASCVTGVYWSYIDTVTLGQTGTYTIFVDPQGDATGSATITTYLVPADTSTQVTPSAGGGAATVSTATPGQNAKVTFTGTPGQRISVLMTNNSYTSNIAGCKVMVGLTAPDSSTTISPSCTNGVYIPYFDTITLTQSGTYTLNLDPQAEATGSMTVTVYSVPADFTAALTPSQFGASTTMSTSTPGTNGAITFTGTSGEQLTIATSSNSYSTSNSGCKLNVSLKNPDGSSAVGASCVTGVYSPTIGPVTLSQAGTYTVLLDPQADATGSVTVTLTNPAGPAFRSLRSTQTAAPARPAGLAQLPVRNPYAPRHLPRHRTTSRSAAGHPRRAAASSRPGRRRSSGRTPLARLPKPRPSAQQILRRPSRAAARAQERHATPRSAKGKPKLAPRITYASRYPAAWTPRKGNYRGDWNTHRTPSPWAQLPARAALSGVTALAGQALKLNGTPLAGVRVSLEHTNVHGRTDATGRFLLTGAPAGHVVLRVDGSLAGPGSTHYGTFEFGMNTRKRRTTSVPFTIWLPKLDPAHTTSLAGLSKHGITLRTPAIPGLRVEIPKGSSVTSPSGKPLKRLGIVAVPVDRPPFPLPLGSYFPIYISVQPAGAYVSRGVKIIYPNYSHLPAGQRVPFWNYDPGTKGWHIYGKGTVSKNGKQIVPDPGVRVWRLSGAMISGSLIPPALKNFLAGLLGADPVNYGTGLFTYKKTDLQLPDVLPLDLTRTYRPADSNSYSFGTATTNAYDMRLFSNANYHSAELIMPDGMDIHYQCVAACTDVWVGGNGIKYVAQNTSSQFYGSTMTWNQFEQDWNITLRNGLTYVFPENVAWGLSAIRDRFGNQVTIGRDATGNLTQVTSPNGHWISFQHDQNNRITQATDNTGRTIKYDYNGQSAASACASSTSTGPTGTLRCVKDGAGGETYYTYDPSSGWMTQVKDARGNTILTNVYDTNGRITKQTIGNENTFYTFAYVLDSGGNVTKSTVTDPNGNQTVTNLDTSGNPTSITTAAGTSVAETTSYQYQAGSGLLSSETDQLGRQTTYGYDSLGNPTSVTQMAGTSSARTTSTIYDSTYSQPTQVTDPFNHTTTFGYDSAGALTSVTDPLNHTVQTLEYAAHDGQVTKSTDALSHSTTYGYVLGDRASVTDPNGNASSWFTDAGGRQSAETDAIGNTTTTTFDPLNDPLIVTDPDGRQTKYTYDADSNLRTIVDANNHTTTLSYDVESRLQTRQDALLKTWTYGYDNDDNLTSVQDPIGQTTTYAPDPQDRIGTITYKTAAGATQSTITNTWDLGDRLTKVVDSTGGTFNETPDNFDELTQESGPNGTLGYTYNPDGSRATSTVTGQAQVAYGYDAAGRLTSIAQGTQNVGLTYDNANRLSTTTLPNGVTENNTYDPGSQLTDTTYQNGATQLGDLHYQLDPLGNRTAQWGSYARLTVPAAWGTASYNADNELTGLGTKTNTYDANGSLTKDTNTATYTWNVRNQLTGFAPKTGTASSFTYDPFGRRKSKTIAGTATNFLYDGQDVVQDLSGSTPQTNYLLGAGLNQRYSRTDTGGTQSFLTDGLGSTLALSNSTATTLTSYGYDPFGQPTPSGAASGNPYQFTGAQNDGTSTGLQYNDARYYSPGLGRFISQDPAGFAASGPNLYQYADGNPTNETDPTGLIGLRLSKQGLGGCIAEILGGGKDLAGSAGCLVGTAITLANPEAAIAENALGLAEGAAKELPEAMGAMRRLEYEAASYHGVFDRGLKSRAPTSGQNALDFSLGVSKNSTRRVGIDYDAGDFVLFDETHPGAGIFHGHVRQFSDLPQAAQNALRRSGMVSSRGKIR